MSQDPQRALEAFIDALTEHYAACIHKRGEDDQMIDSAFERVRESFEDYDEALYVATGEFTPLDIFDDEDLPDEEEAHAD